MTRIGAAARLAVYGLALLVIGGPQVVSLRLGRGRLAGRIPVWIHRLFLRLFHVRVTVIGEPPRGPTLVLANHVSWLDIPVIGSLAPLSFVAKSEVAGWPVVGLLARLQRTEFVQRAKRHLTAQVNQAIAGRLAGGETIVLFAEGTTGDGNRVLPFRASLIGAARAALDGAGLDRVTLQPLAVAYVRRNGLPVTRRERPWLAWYGDMELAPHLAAFVREGPIDATLVWGEPIVFEAGTDRKRAAEVAERSVRSAIREILARADAA